MQVGDLVKWVLDQSKDYGDMGIITEIDGRYVTVHWLDGIVFQYEEWETTKSLEVICE